MSSILIVDDEAIVIHNLHDNMNWNGVGISNVFTALNLMQAKEIFRSNSIDILICDIEMPEGSGIELMTWVNRYYPNTVTIFLTCHEDFAYAKEAVRLGVFDYLLKPISLEDLEFTIRKMLDHHRAQIHKAKIVENFYKEENNDADKDDADVVKRAKALIRQLISHDLTRTQIAELVHLSADYLSHLFKKETGLSLSEYILRERLEMAKNLLEYTNLPIGSIADKVGYSYVSYFDRVFKKSVGTTPAEYRNKRFSAEPLPMER